MDPLYQRVYGVLINYWNVPFRSLASSTVTTLQGQRRPVQFTDIPPVVDQTFGRIRREETRRVREDAREERRVQAPEEVAYGTRPRETLGRAPRRMLDWP